MSTNCRTNERNPRPPIRPANGQGGGTLRLGCHKDMPDLRDQTPSEFYKQTHKSNYEALFKQLSSNNGNVFLEGNNASISLSESVDLSVHNAFTEVEDQLDLGSCTAQAVVGLVEYLIKRATNKELHLSRIFLYKATRNLMASRGEGDSGATIRETIKAMKIFGVPPETWWPYNVSNFDDEPDAFIYAMAQSFQAIDYVRLDPLNSSPDEIVANVCKSLTAGVPVAFGMWVTDGIFTLPDSDNVIPVPSNNDRLIGGHAMLIVGYDTAKRRFKVRNSWGYDWGDRGYAWLPYEYIEWGLAFDFWTIFSTEWLDTWGFSA
ncbi:C1 family peptidase [Aliiglaciecola lipolytica]|uniref:Peptidase C1A papain C-terminal domain-containing protein n=1 Tax=Aliiglaciecola lipolytica E3 TaxID=1127673 RepID=K6XQ88_9ALTE|nr:C1 family peptidase [Aliiglaciecola lipolytica]GAC13826.1 hypothetical protein GLIP_1185 [Aliiglaciecola lipolytica E3]